MKNYQTNWDIDKELSYIVPIITPKNKSYLYMPNPCDILNRMVKRIKSEQGSKHFIKLQLAFEDFTKLKTGA